MHTARNALTPDNLALLQSVADAGSFAAAARAQGLVPSALTYRIRQIEEALDVLLFDRSARQARPTEAGLALLREGARLLEDAEAVAQRVRRVATGWEARFTVCADGVVSPGTLLELVEAFYALQPPTRLKWSDAILSGAAEALALGTADLAIGATLVAPDMAGLRAEPLGEVEFVFALAPHHPLAALPEPLTDATLRAHRLVAVADSARRNPVSMGILPGQDVFTVENMRAKVQAQLRGLGCGFLPAAMVRPYVQAGQLVLRRVARPVRTVQLSYAWRDAGGTPGRALAWWLQQLRSPATRRGLLEQHAWEVAAPAPVARVE
ncbi:DNA-binding transcriptional regulator, LysR family [Oryzisolibacter propanilivorax]|uniref:DNA-binding transcriptional regulator, LysR family n=1 Tax=Oryzisolibacter propanilivorax TaxID=1527607 RepID=A0A1G9PQ20_9BURK|nr:LysR family transcriptional regulator [Oryzisolibacter propanilivorax]SDM00814.1 DNA-binding transcriptional regulator, LysR family [Oryzisolibacter propanilivorax]